MKKGDIVLSDLFKAIQVYQFVCDNPLPEALNLADSCISRFQDKGVVKTQTDSQHIQWDYENFEAFKKYYSDVQTNYSVLNKIIFNQYDLHLTATKQALENIHQGVESLKPASARKIKKELQPSNFAAKTTPFRDTIKKYFHAKKKQKTDQRHKYASKPDSDSGNDTEKYCDSPPTLDSE